MHWMILDEVDWMFLVAEDGSHQAGVKLNGPPYEAAVTDFGTLSNQYEKDDFKTLEAAVDWCEKHVLKSFPGTVFDRSEVSGFLSTPKPKPLRQTGSRPQRCHRCKGQKTVVGPGSQNFRDVPCPVCGGR